MIDKFTKLLNETKFYTRLQKSINFQNWLTITKNHLKEVKKIYIVGNGASCSMASHYAVDFTKNCNIPAESLNDGALLTCFANDFTFEDSYAYMLIKKQVTKNDLVICISSSGNSENIFNVAEYCEELNIPFWCFSGFKEDNKMNQKGLLGCYVPDEDYGFVESAHNFFLHSIINNYLA